MLFPHRNPELHLSSRKESQTQRLPNLEIFSSSHLYCYATLLIAVYRELERESRASDVVDNRRRFLSTYNDMQRDAVSYLDPDSMSLVRAARSLNAEHRNRCLNTMAKLKQVSSGPDSEPMRAESANQESSQQSVPTTPSDLQSRRELKLHYTPILKSWIDNHASHPFPSKKEKAELCLKTSITERQLNNWFINYRRRHRQQE